MAQILQTVGEGSLIIPTWQISLFVALVALSLLFGRIQLGIVVTYFFVLYWGLILYRSGLVAAAFIAVAGGDLMALAFYIFSGLAIAFLTVLAFLSLGSAGRTV